MMAASGKSGIALAENWPPLIVIPSRRQPLWRGRGEDASRNLFFCELLTWGQLPSAVRRSKAPLWRTAAQACVARALLPANARGSASGEWFWKSTASQLAGKIRLFWRNREGHEFTRAANLSF
ncbi:MAG: hypothetical protein DMG72_20050 [Acidobacteria bacterium]|nr:MAG: hypothetical protein DMG96_09875 [Acidobacteriota bacterium]PYX69757.1 MAG: hypothetical protein DMG72_20050 [Acidobacteriota bacterium]